MISQEQSMVQLLAEVVTAHSADAPSEAEAMLLIDHLVCINQARDSSATTPPGVVDRAARRGMLSCASDRDDVSWSQMVHPGSVIWPVVLTSGRDERINGVELLRAGRAGYELLERAAMLFAPQQRARFHVTAAAGTVGVAAASCVLGHHSPTQTADALGHAFSVMGGSAGCLHERSGTRQFHRAHAVRSGMAAAAAAADGLDATRGDLIHSWGIVGPIDSAQLDAILAPSRDAIRRTSIRPYPTSGWNQMAYEAAASAASRADRDVVRIIVSTNARIVAASESHPNVDDAKWVRLDRSVACAVADVLGIDANGLVGRVRVVTRDEPGATVDIVMGTGEVSATVDVPMGHPERPLSLELLARKWSTTADTAQRLIKHVTELLTSTAPDAVLQIEDAVEQSQSHPSHHEETS